jgi:glutaredoxin-related protein
LFGYVKADKPNMLIKDHTEYKAYYCGLCKSIAKKNPQFMRMSVNFDIVALSLIAHNYAKFKPTAKLGRCVIHPISKKFPILEHNEIQARIVDINPILGYYKLKDDVADEKGLKKKIAKLYVRPKYKRAAKRMPEFDNTLSKIYNDFDEIQKSETITNKLPALLNKSAEMLIAVGKAACPNYDEPLIDFCDNLGRWIYLIDAYDDMEKDTKKKSFNPLLKTNYDLTEEDLDKITIMVEANLKEYIARMKEAYDLMDITISEGALSNVVYMGLNAETDAVLKNRGKACKITLL